MARAFPSVVIENLQPLIDGGRYPIKRIVGEDLVVEADIFKDGHDVVAAILKWRVLGKRAWRETPMNFVDNDRWRGVCTLYDEAIHEYTVEAWTDDVSQLAAEFAKKFEAGISDLRSEALEGAALVEAAAGRARDRADRKRLLEFSRQISTGANSEIHAIAQSGELEVLMATYPDRVRCDAIRSSSSRCCGSAGSVNRRVVRIFSALGRRPGRSRIDVSRLFAAGRRRQGNGFRRHLFPADSSHRAHESQRPQQLDHLRAGRAGRAMGDRQRSWRTQGGRAFARDAGRFRLAEKEVRKRGMEIALDFAINCSPDHPYVKEHPDWFYKRPDGTIKYAENPPKKYEDIYPLNFRCENWRELWAEMKSIMLFWAERGVRIFRVDNPHTKPVAFWEYLIKGVREKYPDTIFLSEAFTRPKMMKALAKAGFNQSYTYFTWRNSKHELIEYFTELTQTEMREYFRGNLWPNTPDILPFVLQEGGRPAFMIRVALAATLSPLYGIYSGFELCENAAIAGPRGVSRFRKISVQGARLECARKHQGLDRATKQNPKGKPRAAVLHEPAVPRRRERRHSVLQQDDRRA